MKKLRNPDYTTTWYNNVGRYLDSIDETRAFAREAVKKPKDFGYSGGNDDMFETWALGPVIETRDSAVLERANAAALTRHLESLSSKDALYSGDPPFSEDWEVTRASHWAVGWVDHLSFRALDPNGNPTRAAWEIMVWFEELADNIVADEDLYAEFMLEEQDADWENWYKHDFRKALDKHYGIEWVDSEEYISDDMLYDIFRAADHSGEATDVRIEWMAESAIREIEKTPKFKKAFKKMLTAEKREAKANA